MTVAIIAAWWFVMSAYGVGGHTAVVGPFADQAQCERIRKAQTYPSAQKSECWYSGPPLSGPPRDR